VDRCHVRQDAPERPEVRALAQLGIRRSRLLVIALLGVFASGFAAAELHHHWHPSLPRYLSGIHAAPLDVLYGARSLWH
jgi:hypothetical protein